MPNEQPLDDKFVNVMRFTFGIIILLMMAGLVLGLFFLQIPDGNDNPLVQLGYYWYFSWYGNWVLFRKHHK